MEKVGDAATVIVKEIEIEETAAPVAGKGGTTASGNKMLKVGIEKGQAEGWKWFLEHIFGTW